MTFRALQVLCLCGVSMGWMACGAGHPTITRLSVTPQTATSPLGPQSDTVFSIAAQLPAANHMTGHKSPQKRASPDAPNQLRPDWALRHLTN